MSTRQNKLQLLILLLISVLILVPNVFGQTATPPSSGVGTSSNPYQIATLDNLYWLSQQQSNIDAAGPYWSRSYIQTADIDATNTNTWESGAGFSPIGNNTVNFSGEYNGQNYTIDKLTISRFSTDYIGLFGWTNGATIKNIGLLSTSIVGRNHVGSLIGYTVNTTISNSYAIGSLTGELYVGGLIGSNNTSNVYLCYASVQIYADNYGGGFVGLNQASTISDCYSKGNIERKVVTTNYVFGGFCGYNGPSDGIIENCYSTGNVDYVMEDSPTDKGFIGTDNGGTYSDNFWDKETSFQSTTGSTSYATGKTTIGMKNVATFTNETIGLSSAWDFEDNPNDDVANNNYWDINGGYPFLSWEDANIADAPSSGDGSSSTPYQIATLNNLYWLSQQQSNSDGTGTYWSRSYIQTADIDATVTNTWEGGAGFSPIGNSSVFFSGSYNGDGNTIDALYINRSTNEIGLFGRLHNGGNVNNLGVTNANISGGVSTGSIVGSKTGSSTISNCFSTGAVNGTTYAGGLIGDSDNSTIENSYSKANVTGVSTVGGLIGQHASSTNTSIINSYSTGDVSRISGGSNTTFGGFCGSSNSKIEYSYSTSSVYFIGVSPPTDKGFVALDNSGTYNNNFWDSEASNQSTATGATAKTTTLMKTESTFSSAGWDGNIWFMDSGTNSGYPYLVWENPSGTPLPVELTSFTAHFDKQKVTLNWETATEVNNYGFEIQRASSREDGTTPVRTGSDDGATPDRTNTEAERNLQMDAYGRSWETISFVEGHGNSNSPKSYLFVDSDILAASTSLSYRLKQIDTDGAFEYSEVIEVEVKIIPTEYKLTPNYPNPFNPSTKINFSLPESGEVKLIIYDILGKQVAELVNKKMEAGVYEQTFDASQYSSGVYIYMLSVNGNRFVKKMTLLR
ncbi:MAG: T9SS type A sorting domain-containing protein [Melioribacteraceae bacterium]|nr:T9SS type A sorting domain-containing protein [Melioribacteraceae bacterium]